MKVKKGLLSPIFPGVVPPEEVHAERAGNTFAASAAAHPQWRHVPLAEITISAQDVDTEILVKSMSSGLYLDQLYFVAPEDKENFETMSSDWWPNSSPASG